MADFNLPGDNKNGWQKPQVAPFSGQYKEDRPFLGPHGQRVYFSSRRPRSAEAEPEEEAGTWYVERVGADWSEPKFDSVLTAMGIVTPGFAANGNLYFCSTKRGGLGREDIFVAKWSNGSYAEPESLGKAVNSKFMEAWLFVDPNERYIIFTSFGRAEGTGLYISFRDDNGEWTKARKLGPTINQSGDERFAWVSHDGKYLFFNRQWEKHSSHSLSPLTLEDLHDRSATAENGRGDVYWVDASFIEKLKR